jgi:hypothetical protein
MRYSWRLVYQEKTLKPRIPVTINAMVEMRNAVQGSLNGTIPTIMAARTERRLSWSATVMQHPSGFLLIVRLQRKLPERVQVAVVPRALA